MLTVEDPSASEKVYQTIEEISRNVSENKQGICDRKSSEEKCCQKMKNDYHNKKSLVYGIITAKEMAKYRPSTQNIVKR